MSGWKPMETAPMDGGKIEIKIDDSFPLLAYFGGGQDKGFREWNSCRMIWGARGWREHDGRRHH